MRRHASVLFAYFAQFLKARLVYRADFLMDSTFVFASLFVHLVFLAVLYVRIQDLAGWSIDQLVLIHGFSMIPLGLFNLVSMNLWTFSERHLVEGRFDRVLLRPIHPVFQILFESFNVAALNEVIIGVVLLLVAAARLDVTFTAAEWVALPVLAISGAAVYLGIFLALTATSFWFEDRLGVGAPVYNMIRFARYPVTIYHPAVRALLSWIVPFSFAAFYPATLFLRLREFLTYVWLTPLIGAVLLTLSFFVFSRGMRRYASTGN